MEKDDEVTQAYHQGFYSALKGVLFLTEHANSVAEVTETINDVLNEMFEAGDFDNLDTGVDELIELTREAERLGKVDEFFDMLDQEIEKRGGR